MDATWAAAVAVSLLNLVFGTILGYAFRRFAMEDNPVVERIDEVLPQSRCGQCDYSGCRSYTEAISYNGEKINCCVPGGRAVMLRIAESFNIEPQPLDGEAQEVTSAWMVAVISENNCVGCAECIQTCPADVTVDATHAMHTAMSDLCTNCDLCVDPCPTHCISSQPVVRTPDSWRWDLNTIPVCITPAGHHT